MRPPKLTLLTGNGPDQDLMRQNDPPPLDHIDFSPRRVRIPTGEKEYLKLLLPLLCVVGWIAFGVVSIWLAVLLKDAFLDSGGSRVESSYEAHRDRGTLS